MAASSLPYPHPTSDAQAKADADWILAHPPNLQQSVQKLAQQAAGGVGSAALDAVGLGGLKNPQTWVRIAEGLAGLIILGVGLAKLTGASQPVSRAAKTVVMPELQMRQATRRAASIGTARQATQTAGASQRSAISVTAAGKKAYASSYSREMGRRDARLTKIVTND